MAEELSLPKTHRTCRGFRPKNRLCLCLQNDRLPNAMCSSTFVVQSFGVNVRLRQKDPHHLQVALLDGQVQGVVAPLFVN